MRGIGQSDTPFCFFSKGVVELAGIEDDSGSLLGRNYAQEMATLAWLDYQLYLPLHSPEAHAIGPGWLALKIAWY